MVEFHRGRETETGVESGRKGDAGTVRIEENWKGRESLKMIKEDGVYGSWW